MKKNILTLLVLMFTLLMYAQDAVTTTYYFVRHAEKQVDGTKNPHLTKEGEIRASQWGAMLKNEKIDIIYSTDYFRTKETASGILTAMVGDGEELKVGDVINVKIKTYDPRNINLPKFLEETEGKRVVVVGHSNTTPNFVNSIIGKKKYKSIDESVYGNFYIVTITNGVATATLLATK